MSLNVTEINFTSAYKDCILKLCLVVCQSTDK